jgi:predicted TIM-barrel fold metal-dependent hydrolase
MVIDVHTHAFPDFLARKALDYLSSRSGDYKPVIDGTVNGLVRSMDEAGIDRSFLANIATRPEQARSILAWSQEIASDRIIPLGSIHPASESWEAEIDAIADAGLCGIKLHPQYQGFVLDDEEVLPVYEKIASRNLFILFHAGFDIAFPGDDSAAPERFVKVRREIPGLTMIAAHLGGWRAWDTVTEIMAGLDLYLDTSFIHEVDQPYRDMIISRHDHNRILYASDSPWVSQKESIEELTALNLGDPVNERILGLNALELLARSGSGKK